MSVLTWIDEFAPGPASEVPREQAVAWALRKWTGLRHGNLAKHKVHRDANALGRIVICDIPDEPKTGQVEFDSDDNPICLSYAPEATYESCSKCPVAKTLGRPCLWPLHEGPKEMEGVQPREWDLALDGDPEPMISALKKALTAHVEKETK